MLIAPGVRHRITTTFDGKPVTAPTALGYEVFNDGSDPIRDPSVTFRLPSGTTFLETQGWALQDSPVAGHLLLRAELEPKECLVSEDRRQVTVTLPYLNPFREHNKIRLKVSMIADGDTKHLTITGSGEGWSVRYIPFQPPRMLRIQLPAERAILFAGIGVLGVVLGFVSSSLVTHGASFKNVSPLKLAVVLAVPFGLVGLAVLGVYLMSLGSRSTPDEK